MSYRENEITFNVTQCNNGYVLDTRVDYNFKKLTEIEDGKSIHADVDSVLKEIKRVLTPPDTFHVPTDTLPF